MVLSPGDVLAEVTWTFSGSSQEMAATSIHSFFFPTPSFSGRVQHTSNAGLELQHVTLADSGVFTVEAIVQAASGNLVRLQRSVTVTVSGKYPFIHRHRLRQVSLYSPSSSQACICLQRSVTVSHRLWQLSL
jgi:hypothetical protein